MWIICHNEDTAGLYDADFMDEKVEFSENGTANVSEEIAQAMIEHYDAVEEYESD